MSFRGFIQTLDRLACLAQKDRPVGLCLLFHHVTDVNHNTIGPYSKLSVSPKLFEEIISFISECFSVLEVPELVRLLRTGNSVPENFVMVTFDDGFHDIWTHAFPVLVKYEVPATLYVTTGFIDKKAYPYEYKLAMWLHSQKTVNFEWGGEKYRFELHRPKDLERCYQQIKQVAKPMLHKEREQLLDTVMKFSNAHGDQMENHLFLNWDQIIELSASSLITLGAHTHTHLLLPQLSTSEALEEIYTSKKILEERIGKSVKHFSYPYGACSDRIKEMVRVSGFESGVTTEPRGIKVENLDFMAIPRIEVREGTKLTAKKLPDLIKQCGYL